MTLRLVLTLTVAGLLTGLVGAAEDAAGRVAGRCDQPAATRDETRRVVDGLRAGRDVWGNALLRRPDGPTFAGAARYLAPLWLARAAGGTSLTDSGAHYLAFGWPADAQGSGSVPLHVADGSQIVSQRWRGPALSVGVGRDGRERFGSCFARLAHPRLAGGYLPVLQTAYVDASGVRYRQESFAAPLPTTGRLASFVRVAADAHLSSGPAAIRFTPSTRARRLALPGDDRRPAHRVRGLAQCKEPRSAAADRSRDLRVGSSPCPRLLVGTARRGCADRRSGAARDGRDAQPVDPEPRADLALQRRQPLPGARDGRRDRGRGRRRRLRFRGRRARDPPHLAPEGVETVPRLEAGRQARRRGPVLPSLPRPRVRRRGDAAARPVRPGARAPDRRERHRSVAPRAVLPGRGGACRRAPRAGDGLAGAPPDGCGVGGERSARPGRTMPEPGATARYRPAAGSAGLGGAAPTARCSSP